MAAPFSMPWTNQDTAKLSTPANVKTGNKITAKPSPVNKKDSVVEPTPVEKKKGFFGLF